MLCPIPFEDVAAAALPQGARTQVRPLQQLRIGVMVGRAKLVNEDEKFRECRKIVVFSGSDGCDHRRSMHLTGMPPTRSRPLTVGRPTGRWSVL